MNIRHVGKANNYAACAGDLLITEDISGSECYLMFVETSSSASVDSYGFSSFYFVNIEEGYMFDLKLHKDDEIRVGFKIEGCGEVKRIIPNENIDLVLNESR